MENEESKDRDFFIFYYLKRGRDISKTNKYLHIESSVAPLWNQILHFFHTQTAT